MKPEPAQTQSVHLSDETLDDLLLGVDAPSASAHVAECEACAERLAAFRSSIALFNHASAAWSEARSNSTTRDLAPRISHFRFPPAWSIAAAFFLAVALSFLVGIRRGLTPPSAASGEAGRESPTIRQQEIAGDNAMLDAIDTAISQPVPSPVVVYGIGMETDKTGGPSAQRNGSREVRD